MFEIHALLNDPFEAALWYDGFNLGELLCCEQSHIAEKLKERAAVQKERRKAQEERTLQSPSRARVVGSQRKRRREEGSGAEEG